MIFLGYAEKRWDQTTKNNLGFQLSLEGVTQHDLEREFLMRTPA